MLIEGLVRLKQFLLALGAWKEASRHFILYKFTFNTSFLITVIVLKVPILKQTSYFSNLLVTLYLLSLKNAKLAQMATPLRIKKSGISR